MPPPAPSTLYTDRASIADVLSTNGVNLRLDDDADGSVSTPESVRADEAAAVGTGTVNRFCQLRYTPTQLVTSWSVWDWATLCAAVWLCRRRGNPVPKSLLQERDEALEEMREVQSGTITLEDIAERVTDAPAWSNSTLDPRYRTQQARIQRRRSERTPRQQRVAADYFDDLVVEP